MDLIRKKDILSSLSFLSSLPSSQSSWALNFISSLMDIPAFVSPFILPKKSVVPHLNSKLIQPLLLTKTSAKNSFLHKLQLFTHKSWSISWKRHYWTQLKKRSNILLKTIFAAPTKSWKSLDLECLYPRLSWLWPLLKVIQLGFKNLYSLLLSFFGWSKTTGKSFTLEFCWYAHSWQ